MYKRIAFKYGLIGGVVLITMQTSSGKLFVTKQPLPENASVSNQMLERDS